MRSRLVLSRRSAFCGFLVLALLGAIVSSALPGAGQGHVGDSGAYGQLVDVREYAGTSFGGETAHSIRLDFSLSGSAAPTGPSDTSTGGSTSGTTGGTTGSSTTGSTTGSSTTGSSTSGGTTGTSTTGGPVAEPLMAKAKPGARRTGGSTYKLHPRTWLFRRGGNPGPGEGATGRLAPSDFVNPPRGARAMGAVAPQPTPTTTGGGPTPTTTGGSTTSGTTGSTTGSTTSGNTGGTTSSTTGSTTGGGGTSGYSTTSSATFFCVDAAYFAALTAGGQHPGADYSGDGVAGYNVNRGGHFEYRLPGAATRNVWIVGVSSGRKYHTDAQGNYYDDGPWGATVGYPTTLALSRRDTPSVSIDSRRVYGQPDLDGEIPADPNADLRNPSFNGWQYRGGLFVGVAQGQDQSGTARVQAYVPAGTFTYPLASSLTMLALGSPTNYATPVFGAFVPSPSDPNLATTLATATWANKWDLSQATAVGNGDGMTPVPSGEYSRCFFAGDANSLAVALKDETQAGTWGYFASAAYPLVSDGAPRTWTVDRTATGQGFFHSY